MKLKQDLKGILKLSSVAVFLAVVFMTGACAESAPTAATPRVRPVESPTPEYKPPRRVSRDVISKEEKPARKNQSVVRE